MSIFLDTADIKEIERFMNMGIIRGVTTNPSILLAEKISLEDTEKVIKSIAKLMRPYPVSVETACTFKEDIIYEAKEFASWGDNIVVKIPIHGPNGELENIEAIHELESDGIHINTTAMMNAQQGYLAALAGSSYVSLFGGRINDIGYDSNIEITKLSNLITYHFLKSKIIVGSTREVSNIIDWLKAGAHFVTVTPKLLEKMFLHPYTKETVQQFLKDSLVQ